MCIEQWIVDDKVKLREQGSRRRQKGYKLLLKFETVVSNISFFFYSRCWNQNICSFYFNYSP